LNSIKQPYITGAGTDTLSEILNKKYLPSLIIIITFLCYLRVIFSDFLYYDDDVLLLNNEFVRNLDYNLIKSSFGFNKITHYHPLVFLSFAVENSIFGLNPAVYHLTNLLLHCVNSFLLFLVLKKTGLNDFISYFTMILFALHPIHVESAAWVTERKDLLYTFFYLGAILLYLISVNKNSRKLYFISLIFFIFSCLSKAMAVTLPFVLVIINYFITGKAKFSFRNIFPFLIISIVFIAINLSVAFYKTDITNYSIIDLFSLVCYSILFYPYKIIFPFYLSCIYVYPESLSLMHYLSPLALLVIVMLLLYSRNRLIKFGGLFYLISIIPVLPIIPFGISVTADRFAYVPAAGLFIILSAGLYSLYNLLSKKMQRYNFVYAIFLMVIAASLALLTYNRCSKWANTETLMNDALSYNDKNYYAYFILGNYHTAKHSYQSAVSNYEKCINIKPDYSDAYLNKGNTYFYLSNYEEAINCYNKVVEIDPKDMEAYNNLGVVYENTGELAKAIEYYKKSARLGYEPAMIVLRFYGYEW
jgi:tetratricopeptide (TPR) repeat protein